ncbi:MAG: hypothetical protein K1Y36_24555 [Blastocatellia bacterium]|nr:hypothetical protein [Blastocatellia bacterium]
MALKKGMLKDSVGKALKDEKKAVSDRFEMAETILTGGAALKPEAKPERGKIHRDGFTLPEAEYSVIKETQIRLAHKGNIIANKSEVVRLALRQLTLLTDEELVDQFQEMEKLPSGRPRKDE